MNSSIQPEASVVVTAFDRRDSLIGLLDALNKQSVSSETFEVIVGDDSAEMNIAEKAVSRVRARYGVAVVRTGLPYDVNGVSVARNMGIRLAKGDIVISIDDDCVPNRYFIEEHLSFHKRGYPLIMLGHRSECADKLNENRPVSVTENKSVLELIAGTSDQLNFLNFMTGNLSFPREIAVKAGLFNETFAQPVEHGWEDIEFGYRLWRLGYRTVFARNAVVYRPPTEKEKEERRSKTSATQKACKRFLELHPLVPSVNQFLEAFRQNRTGMAKETGAKVLKEDPENHGVLMTLGEIYLRDKDIEGAQTCFRKALEINRYHPAVHEKLGEIYYLQSRYKEALESFSQSLELDPNRTRSLYYVGQLKERFGDSQLFSQILSREINVELGGGIFPTKIRGESQDDFINVDIVNWLPVDVVADLRNPLPFADESVNNIFSREMIEHLPYRSLPRLMQESYRVLRHGGKLYLCCPDFEAIVALYDKRCNCVINKHADKNCPNCHGKAVVSEEYWRSNLSGNQDDYGDGGVNDTHKNQITYPYLKSVLEDTGFKMIERDTSNRYYEEHKRIIKLSVSCVKP